MLGAFLFAGREGTPFSLSLPSPDTVNTAFHVLKKEECKRNLLNIYVALDQWLGEEGWLVGSFADALARGALTDEVVLRCPNAEFLKEIADGRLSGHPFFGGSSESTYFWEFPDPEDGRWFLRDQLNRREFKWRQLHLFGGDTPLVRCNYHGATRYVDWLNLSFNGEIYASDLFWEDVTMWGSQTSDASIEWWSGEREFARLKALRSLLVYSGPIGAGALGSASVSADSRPLVELGRDRDSGAYLYTLDCANMTGGRLFSRSAVRSLVFRLEVKVAGGTSVAALEAPRARIRLRFGAGGEGESRLAQSEPPAISPSFRHESGSHIYWGARVNYVDLKGSTGVGRWLTNESYGPREPCFGSVDVAPHSFDELVAVEIESSAPVDRLALMESWADESAVEFFTTFDADSRTGAAGGYRP